MLVGISKVIIVPASLSRRVVACFLCLGALTAQERAHSQSSDGGVKSLSGRVSHSSRKEHSKRGETEDERFEQFNGKIIRSVAIRVNDIFEEKELNWLYRTANSLKINTREQVVRRELLFSEGDPYDDFLARESERRLRGLRYLRKVSIVPVADADYVDITVNTQDTWTFLPQFGYGSTSGRTNFSAVLTESNIAGWGKRFEAGYAHEEQRQVIQAIYDDNRLFGGEERFVGGLFQRSDGHQAVLFLGRPFRSLADRSGWFVNTQLSDTVGRLFAKGEEDYIFRQENNEFSTRYTFTRGDPEQKLFRYSLGYTFQVDDFTQADLQDYEDLDLDPAEVDNDPERLAQDRRFSGPVFSFQSVTADYISLGYIDRFERVEDYNLGEQYDLTAFVAPTVLGSDRNAALLSLNRSEGLRFGRGSFVRGEVGLASRLENDGFENTLARAEVKYYSVLGDVTAGDIFLGKHTLALGAFIDYGDNLDADRQFTIGGDNALRGYRSRAFTGDKRVAINIEDRIHLVDDLFQLVSVGAAVFVDAGGATYNELDGLFENGIYSNVGAGLRFAFPRSSGGRVVRLDFAVPMRSAEDGTDQFQVRLSVGGGQLFSSQLRSESFGPERANLEVGFDR